MKIKYILIFLFISSLSIAQNSDNYYNKYKSNYDNNSKPYDDLYNKKEQDIKSDRENKRNIINQVGVMDGQLDEENEDQQETALEGGPGAPGEPVSINSYLFVLFLVGCCGICWYSVRKEKK